MNSKLLPYALSALLIFGCSEDESTYTCDSCVDTPEAIAANDNSGKGIYKGLVVGSSGTIKFDIANNGTSIIAVLKIDGQTYELSTSATYTANGLTGSFVNANAGITIGFLVTAEGGASITSITIPGHPNATIELYKEKSNALVRVFEGKFGGSVSGIFNLVTRGEQWIVIAKANGSSNSEYCSGILTNEELTSNCDITITGKINNDEVSGKWDDDDGKKGSWSGKRTL
jgi:hypothetical protein